jgi:hypothetical protein
MPARPFDRIVDSIVKQEGPGAKMRRKLAANREQNWLLALTLNSFAKLTTNAPLSDLEQSIVDAYRKNGFTDEQLKQHGRAYLNMPAQARRDIFPGKFAQLTPEQRYTMQDLRNDAPAIVSKVLSMPNVTKIDVEAVHAGTAHLREFVTASRSVVQEHGSALLIATEPNTAATATARYRIKATSFRCNDETGVDFLGSDEPYWIFGSLGGGTAVTTRSQVFGDVDTGETRNFATNEGCIWGQNCAAQELPDGEIGTLIQLWEHDSSNPEQIRAGVAAAFAAAAGILAATGVAAWISAVVTGVGAVVKWLLGALDDDHIADQTFVFTRQVIENQLKKAGQSFNITRRFSDGDGDYTLTIQVSRAS